LSIDVEMVCYFCVPSCVIIILIVSCDAMFMTYAF